MNIGLIVIVVLVTEGHIRQVSSSTSCVQSKNVLAVLSELEVRRLEAISGRLDGYENFFHTIETLAVEYVFDLKPKTPYDCDENVFGARAMLRYKQGIDHSLNSIPIALKKSCDGIDNARAVIYTAIENFVATVTPMIASARSGNYFKERAKMEAYRATIHKNVTKWITAIYDLIRTCLNTTDADALTAIESAENDSSIIIHRGIGAFCDAIKLLSIAITYGHKNLALIYDVRECRIKTLEALRSEVDHSFAIIEALHVNCCSKQAGSVSTLAAIQYTMIKTSYNAVQIAIIVGDQLIDQSKGIRFGTSNQSGEIPSRIDVAKAKTTSLITSVADHFSQLIAILYPKYSTTAKNGGITSRDEVKKVAATYYRFIEVALDRRKSYSEIKIQMDIAKEKEVNLLANFTRIFTVLLRDNHTWSKQVENEFATIIRGILDRGNDYIQSIQDGAEKLAKIARASETGTAVCSRDVSAIQAAKSKGISVMIDYCNFWFQAFRFSILADSENKTTIQCKS